jgi:uncharacterized protein YndB with AHSA1/START domain
MAPITTTVEVARAPEEVFAYVTDPARFAQWQEGVTGGHVAGAGADEPQKVGDKCVNTRRIGGMERAVTSEITHVDAPRRWRVRGVDGPVRATVEVTVAPLEDGSRSRVAIALEFTGHGIGKLLVPLLVVPGARREMASNVQRLKQRLEAAAPSGR